MGKKKRSMLREEEGFTLTELMVALVVLALIIYAGFNLMDVNLKAGNVYTIRADLSQELREATGTMVDQLRTARSFTAASATSVTFTSYLMGTNDLYNVQFLLDEDDHLLIQRADTGPLSEDDDKVLASGVTSLRFAYYDAAGTLLDNPGSALASITLVEVELTMTKSSGAEEMTDSLQAMARARR